MLTIVALDLCQARFPSSYRGLDSVSGTDQDRLVLLTIVALDLCQARFQSLSKGLDSVSGLDQQRLVLLAIVFLDLATLDSPGRTKVWTAFLALIKTVF